MSIFPTKILLATDGSERRLYEQIEEVSRELLRKLTWQVKVAGGTVAGAHLRMGQVDLEIVSLAKELGAGLIVMGCRGHRGIRRVIEGSISAAVIRHAPCPVLVVRRTRATKVPGNAPSSMWAVGERSRIDNPSYEPRPDL